MHKVSGLIATTVMTLMAAAQVQAQSGITQTATEAIPAQPLAGALQAWASQTGWQIMYDSALVNDQESSGAPEGVRAIDGLRRILDGTGLAYSLLNDRTVAILEPSSSSHASHVYPVALRNARLANAEAGTVARTSDESQSDGGRSSSMLDDVTEVVVTAQKRTERLQDVPVPVAAVGAEALVNSNQLRLQEYYTRLPGLSVTPDEFGTPVITIRGVTTGGFSNPTVGVVIDDVPYGASTLQGGGKTAPDVDPTDLARIEVLRGPQGTLYGASSLGGLLKYVTVDPSTDRMSGRVSGGFNNVRNGDEMGYNVSAAFNAPLSDTLALRVSGFKRRDPGYIDDPGRGAEGVNEGETDGGRLATLWKPNDTFSVKLNALIQDTKFEGSSLVSETSGLDNLEQENALSGYGGYNRRIQAYDATINAKLGSFDLTSVSGYSTNKFADTGDLGGGLAGDDHYESDKFTQEVRLNTQLGEKTDWLLGAFYTHEKNEGETRYFFVDPDTGDITSTLFDSVGPSTFAEHALFTDVTYHFTDQFAVQLGGRESHNRQTSSAVSTGPLVGGLQLSPELKTDDSAFTYLVTPQYKISPDAMIYARLASGYRPGGPNLNAGTAVVPENYGPDKTANYEIGLKGDALNKVLSYDASVFYIDWKDIQVQLIDPVARIGYLANATSAKSQGVELSLEARPRAGLVIASWVAWTDAKLREGFPTDSAAFGEAGDRLPNSSRFSGNLSIDQEFLITSDVTAFVGGSLSYVGDRVGLFKSTFTGSPEREKLPSYAKTDIRIGAKYDLWTFNVFVNNLTDRRGVLSGGLGSVFPTQFALIQPRMAGLSVSKGF